MEFNQSKLDSGERLYFSRQLEYISSKIYETKYPELKATMLIPVNASVDNAADSYTYRTYDGVAMAKIISNYADDLPTVEVFGKEDTSIIKSLGDSYEYSIQDIRRSQRAGINLQTRKATLAKKGIDQKVDQIAWLGDAENNLKGFINASGILTQTAAATGTGSSTKWADKTADQILEDLNAAIRYMADQTKGVESPDTLLLPIEQYAKIATMPRSTMSDTTVLDFFKKNHPEITTIEGVYNLKGAGAASADVFFMYRKSPEYLELIMPQPFEQFPPQEQNLAIKVPCHARTGGVVIYYPLSVIKVSGI